MKPKSDRDIIRELARRLCRAGACDEAVKLICPPHCDLIADIVGGEIAEVIAGKRLYAKADRIIAEALGRQEVVGRSPRGDYYIFNRKLLAAALEMYQDFMVNCLYAQYVKIIRAYCNGRELWEQPEPTCRDIPNFMLVPADRAPPRGDVVVVEDEEKKFKVAIIFGVHAFNALHLFALPAAAIGSCGVENLDAKLLPLLNTALLETPCRHYNAFQATAETAPQNIALISGLITVLSAALTGIAPHELIVETEEKPPCTEVLRICKTRCTCIAHTLKCAEAKTATYTQEDIKTAVAWHYSQL